MSSDAVDAASRRDDADQRAAARRSAVRALGLVVFMGALGFAFVPLYDLFCRVTGFGGATIRGDVADIPAAPSDATITVLFDANTARDLPWTFEPVERRQTVRIGESSLAFYRATNTSDRPITGTASFNVAPYELGGYFVKVACFCFQEQTLQPGESVDMPVSYFVDPELLDDPERGDSRTVTLSYTFFPVEDQTAALAAPAE